MGEREAKEREAKADETDVLPHAVLLEVGEEEEAGA
jgi:hypothetical protein